MWEKWIWTCEWEDWWDAVEKLGGEWADIEDDQWAWRINH